MQNFFVDILYCFGFFEKKMNGSLLLNRNKLFVKIKFEVSGLKNSYQIFSVYNILR